VVLQVEVIKTEVLLLLLLLLLVMVVVHTPALCPCTNNAPIRDDSSSEPSIVAKHIAEVDLALMAMSSDTEAVWDHRSTDCIQQWA
jgi:hypothetical protein